LTLRLFDPFVLVEMGRVYLLKGEPEKALAVLEGLDTVADVRSSLLFYRGSARLDLGMLDKAKSDLLRLVDADPDLFPRVYYNLADISGQEHEVGLSHYYLGLYYHTIKEERNALFHFEKSLGAMDDPDRIERAKALISELKKKNKAPSSRGSSTSLSVLQSGLVKP
jgi:tetratricopeptide (TPR) repeat protein